MTRRPATAGPVLRLVLSMLVLGAVLTVPAAPGSAGTVDDEARFVAMINDLRRSHSLNTLTVDGELTSQARRWSAVMADDNQLKHASDLSVGISAPWDVLGENVGVHTVHDLDALFQAFVASPAHLDNLLDPRFDVVGVGVVHTESGSLWTTHRFMSVTAPPPPPAAVAPPPPTTPPQVPDTPAPTPPPPPPPPPTTAAPAPPAPTAAPAPSAAPPTPAAPAPTPAPTSTAAPAPTTAGARPGPTPAPAPAPTTAAPDPATPEPAPAPTTAAPRPVPLAPPADGPVRPIGAARPPAALLPMTVPDRRVSLVVLDLPPGPGTSPGTRELIAQVLADLADSGI